MSAELGAGLVFGGASGIGAACVTALRRSGWRVAVADLRGDPADGGTFALDVRDPEAVASVVGRVVAAGGPLGVVVYAAGAARVTRLLEIDAKEWELVMAVNLDGAFNALRATVPHMPRGASFTLISSIDSQAPVAGLAHYSAAKAGGEALVRGAALELGERGIRVNAVLPGVVRTPLMAPQLARPEVHAAFIAQTPLGAIGEPAEIADVVGFLASPAARWITGVSLAVDGGLSLREHPQLLESAPA